MNFYHDFLIPRVNVFFLPRHVVRANWTPMVSEVWRKPDLKTSFPAEMQEYMQREKEYIIDIKRNDESLVEMIRLNGLSKWWQLPDQCLYLSNYAPTLPITQQQSNLRLMLGKGRGRCAVARILTLIPVNFTSFKEVPWCVPRDVRRGFLSPDPPVEAEDWTLSFRASVLLCIWPAGGLSLGFAGSLTGGNIGSLWDFSTLVWTWIIDTGTQHFTT